MKNFETQTQTDERQKMVVEMYDRYTSGQIQKDQLDMFLCEELKSFIHYIINRKRYNAYAEVEDMRQAAFISIIERSKKYNPRKVKITTFFGPWIEEACEKTMRKSSLHGKTQALSKHYIDTLQKLQKTCQDAGFCGYEDAMSNGISIAKLSQISGIAIKSIQEAIRQKELTFCHMEDPEFMSKKTQDTPESLYEKREREEEIKNLLKSLNPLEVYLIEVHAIAEKPASMYKIVAHLKTPEMREKFKKWMPKSIDQNTLQKIETNALCRIRERKELRKIGVEKGFISKEEEEVYSQAEIDDLSNMLFEL